MTEAEKADVVEAAMGETPPQTPKGISVSWDDFLTACAERKIEFVEGKTVFQMREDFLKSLDAVVPDSQEEADLSQLVVDIQIALVDGAQIIGSPEEKPVKGKKAKVKKEKKIKEPKLAKPKKEKAPRVLKPRLGGIGMKPMCRDLFGDMTKEQVTVAGDEIKNKLAQVYVEKGKDLKYGLNRAERIFYDIHTEKFGPPTPKAKAVPKEKPPKPTKEKKEKAAKVEDVAAGAAEV